MDHSSVSDYMAHGFCLLWEPELVWLHVVSDILTGITYYSIPASLFYFIYKRRDIPFQRIFILFGIFIFACGTTHLFAAYTIFVPAYWAEGIIKGMTAFVSVISAVLLIPLIPQAIALPSLTSAMDSINKLNQEMNQQLKELRIKDDALASSITAIAFSDIEGNITYVNDAFLGLWGYDTETEVLGSSLQSLFEFADQFSNVLESLNSQGTWKGELRIRNTRGIILPTLLSASTVVSDSGSLIGYMTSFTDITEMRALEEQLRQSQKLEAIGQLAGGVAHDFNNILSAIVGYAHLSLMKMHEDDPSRPFITQILDASTKATTLTQSLLSFSRKQMVDLKVIDINDLLQQFEKFLLRLIREDIDLKIIYASEELTVLADKVQIEQAVMNLVTNARDSMPDGGSLIIETKLITMDAEYSALHGYGVPGYYACITVSDTGTGMDSSTQEKIFEPFFTTKDQGKGTGLGLAMAYGIVKKHNGYINVDSDIGKGAVFRILLPIVRIAPEKEAPMNGEKASVAGGTETILIAEDDAAVRKLTAVVLASAGYGVIEAIDGEDAVRKFRENKDMVQLVVLDGIMPKKNGYQAYEEIKQLKPEIKTIFASGYSEEIFSKLGISREDEHFLLKPIVPSDLLRKIRAVLDA